MWCPEKFITAEAVHTRLDAAISKYMVIDGSGVVAGRWGEIRRNITAKEIFADWAIWLLLRSSAIDAFICSPSGTILKTSKMLFAGPERLLFDDFIFPVPRDTPLAAILEEIREREKEGEYKDWVANDGFFVEPWTWLVRSPGQILDNFASQEEDRLRKSYRDFLRDQSEQVSTETATTWIAEDDGDTIGFVTGVSERISKFAGWSVCFREDDIPSDMEALLEETGVVYPMRERPESRGISPSEVADTIVRMHKEGHPVVRDNIRRQLAHEMKTEQWRETWKIATTQCPELSRRGPKTRRRSL
jgi:hypothetical protein